MQRYDNEGKDGTSGNKDEEGQGVSNQSTGEVFVKNLSFKTTNEECKKYFEQFGKVKSVNILQKYGRSKGMGFVTFEEPKDAIALIESKKELSLDERPLNVSWPSSKKRDSPQESNTNTKTIFVGNLSFKATEKGIEDFFADCGKVVSVRIANDYLGRSKGFCYVDFENEEAVAKAIQEKNGKPFEEREIRVDRANPKSDDDRDYGRGRGGYGFRRGRGGRGSYRGRGRGGYDNDYNEGNHEYRGRGNGDFRGRGRGDFRGRGRGDFRGRGRDDFKGRDDFRGGRDDFRGGRDDFRGRGRDDFRGRGRDDFRGGRDDFRGGRDDFRGGRDDFRGGRDDFRGGRDDFRGRGRGSDRGRGRDDFRGNDRGRGSDFRGRGRGGY